MVKNKQHTPLQIINYIYEYSLSPIILANDKTIIHNCVEINKQQNVIFKSCLYESMITHQITSTLNNEYIYSYDFFLHLYNYYYLMFVYKDNKTFMGYTQVDIHGILPALLIPFQENNKEILKIFLTYIEPSATKKQRIKKEIKQNIFILYEYFKYNKLLIDL